MTMSRSLCYATTALAAWFCFALPAAAMEPEVRDNARMFSSRAVSDANRILKEIKKTTKVEVVIETFETIPSDRQQEAKSQDEDAFVTAWANQRARTVGVKGIYVLVCRNPSKLRIMENLKTAFTTDNVKGMSDRMLAAFKQKKWDDGLLAGVRYAQDTLAQNTKKPGGSSESSSSGEWSIWGIIIAVIVGLLIMWVVIGLIRAFTGGGGGGYGGGGYGGGGGGGFFSSLMGGLFGAAAGMWLYNSFFNTPSYSSPPGDTGGGDTGPETTDDYSGGGGDYGDSGGDAGGDWGGGGGDFGGGGDWGGGDF